MKMRPVVVLALAAAAGLVLALAPWAPTASAFEYTAKVWSSDGSIYYLKTIHLPYTQPGLPWWKADGTKGVWAWEDIHSIEFPKNIGWWKGGEKEMKRGRMAEVRFWDGGSDKAYVEVDSVSGEDPWGPRVVEGSRLTKVEFATKVAPPPVPPQTYLCKNGHSWDNPGFRFCPYDGQKLELGKK